MLERKRRGGDVATEKATFGAGCFWQVEAEFRATAGVSATAVGYTGGSAESPSYEQVCNGATGHAEAVEVEFDPEQATYEDMLEIFWANHDPTTLDRQGPDIGSQYRSAVFFHSPEQEQAAVESRERAQIHHKRPIVTEIVPATKFWLAEDYHQQYLEKRGMATCKIGA